MQAAVAHSIAVNSHDTVLWPLEVRKKGIFSSGVENRPFYSSRRHIGLAARKHDTEAEGDPAPVSNSCSGDILRVNRLSVAISYSRMVLRYKDKDISSLEDIQKLSVKDLREQARLH